jgi:hypothetical protein
MIRPPSPGGEERGPPPPLRDSGLTYAQYHYINYMSSRIDITLAILRCAGLVVKSAVVGL